MKINRGPAPQLLQSDDVRLAIQKLEEFYFIHPEMRSQRRYDFPFNDSIDAQLKPHLHQVFGGRCGYCEAGISSPEDGVVDRFRPFSGVRDENEYHPDLYWWLTFKWDNLVYACKTCSQYKANYFPIAGRRALSPKDDLAKEDCLLFDPCNDDSSDHFTYRDNGAIDALTDKGAQTMSLLRLHRHTPERSAIKGIITNLCLYIVKDRFPGRRSESVDRLKDVYNRMPSISFASFRRWCLFQELELYPTLRGFLGIDEKMTKKEGKRGFRREGQVSTGMGHLIVNDYFPIEYIRIQNFRGISDLTIHFREDEEKRKSWLFLLGENGVGKSSILQAIAVGIGTDKSLEGLTSRLIQNGKDRAEITIKERNSDKILTTILTRKDNKIERTGSFSSFLLGYGSLRLSEDEAGLAARPDDGRISYGNLLRPVRPLNDITAWLRKIFKDDPALFDRVAYSIKQLLPHDFADSMLTIKDGELFFKDSRKSFSELSDGFKSTITLAVDIMIKLSAEIADMDKMTGIVLIDELGNQLHPRWQMRIVGQLRRVFTNLNFIVSTHHPLVLRGSEQGEILLLKGVDGEITPVTDLPDPAPLRVDQILSSEFFGLSSLIDPALEARFNRYYQLLGKGNGLSDAEQKEIIVLRDELRSRKHLGSSLREELMYHAIDSLLASKLVYDKNVPDRESLKREVVDRVREMWKQLNIDGNDFG